MSRHYRHIHELFLLAQDVIPVGAARVTAKITINNREIGYGVNSYKTDPFQKKYGKNSDAICIHAELQAIKNALKRTDREDLENATLYVARAKMASDNKTFTYGLAKPCIGCMRAIAAFNIKNVIFTCDEYGELETL